MRTPSERRNELRALMDQFEVGDLSINAWVHENPTAFAAIRDELRILEADSRQRARHERQQRLLESIS